MGDMDRDRRYARAMADERVILEIAAFGAGCVVGALWTWIRVRRIEQKSRRMLGELESALGRLLDALAKMSAKPEDRRPDD